MDIAFTRASSQSTRPRIMLGLPHMGQICTNLMVNILKMLDNPNYQVLFQPLGYRRPVDAARNELVEIFLASDSEWLLMVDADMADDPLYLVAPRFLELADANEDVVGALGLMWKDGDVVPTVLYYDEKAEGLKVMEQFILGDLVECDATGSGVLMIHRPVLEKLEPPYFKYVLDPTGKLELGQDFYFCQKAREAGFRIFVQTGIMTSHFQTIDLLDVWKRKIGKLRNTEDTASERPNIRRIK